MFIKHKVQNFLFKYRSYTPIPLAVYILATSENNLSFVWAGLLCLGFGETVRFLSVRYAGGVTRTTKVGAPALCTAGPYSYVRNPLYLGNMFMYSGVVFIAGSNSIWIALIITWLFFLFQYGMIVSLEESTLENLFGERYIEYKQNVPALIPRLRPWKSGDLRKPLSLSKTFKTEKRTLQNVILILLIISLLNYL